MGRSEPWWRQRWKKEGPGLPVPGSGAKRYFFLNLLFCLFCLPIVTMPAALCGINRVFIKLIREGHCFLWTDFIAEFKSSFPKSLPVGLLFGGGLFASWYLMSLGMTNGETLFGLFFSAMGIFLLLFTLLISGWTFVLIAMLPLKNRDLLKNACALATLEKGRSAAILCAAATPMAIGILLFPLSLPALVVFLIGLAWYTICFLVNEAVQVHIVEPWEARGDQTDQEDEG